MDELITVNSKTKFTSKSKICDNHSRIKHRLKMIQNDF